MQIEEYFSAPGHHFSDNLKVCRGVLLQLEINEIQAAMCGSDKASVFPTILRSIPAALQFPPPPKSNPELPKVWMESEKEQLHSSSVDERGGASRGGAGDDTLPEVRTR